MPGDEQDEDHRKRHGAKKYISEALSAMLDLGAGSGPMDHAYWV